MAVNRASAFLLMGAVATGAGAAYFTDNYIQGEIDTYRKSIEGEYAPVKVVVPKRPLYAGDTLLIDNLAAREIPKSYAHQGAVTPDSVNNYIGKRLIANINPGETLLPNHMSRGAVSGFSGMIEKGKRALTFPVDNVSSISGMLRPGDHIDLLATLGSGTERETFPLLRNVTILATGIMIDESQATEESIQYQTITLAVSPEEAAKITHAREIGTMTVVLRAQDDEQLSFNKRITKSSLLGKKKKVSRPAKVEVILGGRK